MAYRCKSSCERIENIIKYSIRHGAGRAGAYKTGYKRCAVCEVFLFTSDNFCFCCGVKLRFRGVKAGPRFGNLFRKMFPEIKIVS